MTPRPVLTLRPRPALFRALEAEAVRRRMRVERFVLEAAAVRVAEGRTRRRGEGTARPRRP